MKFINLTPHAISIIRADGTTLDLPKPVDGTEIPRVAVKWTEHSQVAGVALVMSTYGDVVGLPEIDDDVTFIVSGMVLDAARGRPDLAAPGELVRAPETGLPVGYLGLRVASWRPVFRG